jgi:serine/threonine protein phosphatase PrpC
LRGNGDDGGGVLVEAVAEIATGDSRPTRPDAESSPLTSDHSWVNEQVQSGVIDSEQARNHPLRTWSLGLGQA